MLALMNTAKPDFLEIDNDKFKTIMKISNNDSIEQKKDYSGNDEESSKTLQLLRIKGFPRLLPEGIETLVNYCQYLQELSLSYSLLSDELLIALSSEKQVQLETLRLEVHPETKPLPRVSDKAWFTFSSHLPNINLVLLSYMTNEDDQSPLFAPYVPITHLYFGEAPSEATALCIGHQCPRLIELVIAAYGPGLLDHALQCVAQGCPRLSAVGLGDCEITVDPFTRKDWYDVKAPSMFTNRHVGKTLVNRTQGTKIASEGLKYRVFEVSLADLQNDGDAERSFRKFRLIAEDVQHRNVLTNFHGMDLTTDKLRSMVKKWQTLIEANVDVKTTDGYLLRVFCIGFTNKDQLSTRKTCYAQHAQVKKIRQKMVDTITNDVTKSDLKGVVSKLLPDATAKDIEKASQGIYPLHDVYIRKVKVLKKPRFELSKLLELHGDGVGSKSEEVGESGSKVDRPEGYEPPVQESV
ncbi:40S ribosomal protein S3a [Eufriesea mexicana]|nr:40S ribosomal protein S3a [Eufriesea mexicana]